jgi:hypothetical protein
MEQGLLKLSFPLQTQSKRWMATSLLGLVWVLALSIGLRALLGYESTPGRVGAISRSWPIASKVPLAAEGQTLLMFAHPRCPCTRASMGELAEVMARVQGKVHAYVLFLKPDNSGTDWDDTDLRRAAAQIPGVAVLSDLNGTEARRFGAETSGFTLLFNSAGVLLFNGGITAARGHAGGNAGENAIISLINKNTANQTNTFVFGCSLLGRTEKGEDWKCRN